MTTPVTVKPANHRIEVIVTEDGMPTERYIVPADARSASWPLWLGRTITLRELPDDENVSSAFIQV